MCIVNNFNNLIKAAITHKNDSTSNKTGQTILNVKNTYEHIKSMLCNVKKKEVQLVPSL